MGADRPRLRRLATVVLALAAAVPAMLVAPRPVAAAAPSLTFVTTTTYEVRPEAGRVAVSVRITATNHLKDSVTKRYFFDAGYLAVQPGTSGYAISGGSGTPSVAVSSRSADGVVLRIRFGARLAAGASTVLTLTYDLVDPGGAPDRPLRISPSIVTFQAWAHATPETPGSSVQVRIPDGYTVSLGRGPLTGPTTDPSGWQVYSSGELAAPLDFVADVDADRDGGLVDGRRSTSVGDGTVVLLLRAWPDDPGWRDRVGDLVRRGLTALGTDIGVGWSLEEPLVVEEVLARARRGDAGTFDPSIPRMDLGYAASTEVVLHETAHGWFNGRLVGDRWIAEGFAAWYAGRAASALGMEIVPPSIDGLPAAARLPLNAWAAPADGESGDDEYGFGASYQVAAGIAAIVGEEGMRSVWQAAATGRSAYQPPEGSTETGAPPPDWRAFLDLLEAEVATDRDPAAAALATERIEALYRRWVLRPADVAILDARTEARTAYAEALAAADGWALPRAIRDALRAWQFDAASRLIGQARDVLDLRAQVARGAADAGLTPPTALRAAFEGGTSLDAAAAEATTELAVISVIDDAVAARVAAPGPMDQLGLIGLDPDASLNAARAAFARGDLDAAVDSATAARSAWQAVPGRAGGRIMSVLLLLGAMLLLVVVIRLRRARRPGWSR